MTGSGSLGAADRSAASYLALGPRAVLVDEVEEVGESRIVCSARVTDASPYRRGQAISGVVLLEYLAQTVGVFVGYREVAEGNRPGIGLLVGCQRARIDVDEVPVGTSLVLEARQDWGRRDFGAFECRATSGGDLLAIATLTVVRPDEAWRREWSLNAV